MNIKIGLATIGLVVVGGGAVYVASIQKQVTGQVLGTIIYDDAYGYQSIDSYGYSTPVSKPTSTPPASVNSGYGYGASSSQPVASAVKVFPATPTKITIRAGKTSLLKNQLTTLTATVYDQRGKVMTAPLYWAIKTGSITVPTKPANNSKNKGVVIYKAGSEKGKFVITATTKDKNGKIIGGNITLTIR